MPTFPDNPEELPPYLRCPDTIPVTKPKRPRGHPRGNNVRPRDENGWLVPEPGTKSAQCYDMLLAGLTATQIAPLLNIARVDTVHQMIYRIKNPEKVKYRKNRRLERIKR